MRRLYPARVVTADVHHTFYILDVVHDYEPVKLVGTLCSIVNDYGAMQVIMDVENCNQEYEFRKMRLGNSVTTITQRCR